MASQVCHVLVDVTVSLASQVRHVLVDVTVINDVMEGVGLASCIRHRKFDDDFSHTLFSHSSNVCLYVIWWNDVYSTRTRDDSRWHNVFLCHYTNLVVNNNTSDVYNDAFLWYDDVTTKYCIFVVILSQYTADDTRIKIWSTKCITFEGIVYMLYCLFFFVRQVIITL